MTKRLAVLLLAGLPAGTAACDNEENNESPEQQAESARSGSDDAAERDSTDGID